MLQVPLGWVLFAVGFSFLMMMVNGISLGITDSNPISTAFVLSVVIMAGLGLVNPIAGLLAGSIVFVCCSIGGDMQQDRSTGWRLGTNRTIQFRYQLVGVILGAVLAVFMAQALHGGVPGARRSTPSDHPEAKVAQWQSAMTYKFVGALDALTHPKRFQIPAILVGVAIGARHRDRPQDHQAERALQGVDQDAAPATASTSCSTARCSPRPTRRRSPASSS